MDMKCDIIRDLMPSYIDGLTSEASTQAVEEHLKECGACRRHLEMMKAELVSESYAEEMKKESETAIRPFRKLRKMTFTAVAVTALAFILLFCAYIAYFETDRMASVSDVEISYRRAGGRTELVFSPAEKGIRIGVGEIPTDELFRETGVSGHIRIVKMPARPFDSRDRNAYFGYDFADERTIIDWWADERISLDGDETLTIDFADAVKEIRLSDLYEGNGLEKLTDTGK